MAEFVTKSPNNQIIVNAPKMELFVPNEYFNIGLGEEVGTGYRIFGYARAYHYGNKDDDRDKAVKNVLAYPLKMITRPSEVHVESIAFPNHEEEKYRVFTYYKNDVLMDSAEIIQDGGNIQTFYNMMMAGKLDIIQYKHIPSMLNKCAMWNKVSFNVPAMYEEVIISDYYRDPKNPARPARYAANESPEPFYALGITQRTKVSTVSTFAGLTFEDITSMLTIADNNKRNGVEEEVSQVEENSLSQKSSTSET